MDEKDNNANLASKAQSLPLSNIQQRNRVDKIADCIVLALAIIFALLLSLVWLTKPFNSPLYADQQLVDEAEDPLADFGRYSCPVHYGKNAPFAVTANSVFSQAGKPKPVRIQRTPDEQTFTEIFYYFFNDFCVLLNTQKTEIDALRVRKQLFDLGPNETAFWRDIMEDAFSTLGYKYDKLNANIEHLNASDIWRMTGRLLRLYRVDPPFGIGVTDDRLEQNKIFYINTFSYPMLAEVKNVTDDSPEMQKVMQQVQQYLTQRLYTILPIMTEGSKENITDSDLNQFFNGFVQLASEYRIDQIRIHLASASNIKKNPIIDTRKFSDTQKNIVKESNANIYTVGQLMSKYPNIGWRPFLEGLLDNPSHPMLKNSSSRIYIMSPELLKNFDAYFAKGMASLQRYYLHQIIELVSQTSLTMEKDCYQFEKEMVPQMESFSYVRTFPQAEAEYKVYAVKQMVKTIMEEYKAAIWESDWLTETSKNNLAKKLKSMAVNVGWPEWFKPYDPLPPSYANRKNNNSGKFEFAPIDEYHRPWFRALRATGFEFDQIPAINRDLLEFNETVDENAKLALFDRSSAIFSRIIVALSKASSVHELDQIGQKPNRKEGMNAAVFNAQYLATTNALDIAYFTIDKYFNAEQMVETYGKIGHAIAHEIGHGFDERGMLFGSNGEVMDKLLDKKSAQEFDRIQQCIVDLYANECCIVTSNLTLSSTTNGSQAESKICTDGWLTQGENFADISGITMAYRAFKKRTRLLHGGHFELAKRKFWVGYAALWCKPLNEFELYYYARRVDPHPPNQCRVRLPPKAVAQFAYDFGSKSPLINDGRRCSLWTIN